MSSCMSSATPASSPAVVSPPAACSSSATSSRRCSLSRSAVNAAAAAAGCWPGASPPHPTITTSCSLTAADSSAPGAGHTHSGDCRLDPPLAEVAGGSRCQVHPHRGSCGIRYHQKIPSRPCTAGRTRPAGHLWLPALPSCWRCCPLLPQQTAAAAGGCTAWAAPSRQQVTLQHPAPNTNQHQTAPCCCCYYCCCCDDAGCAGLVAAAAAAVQQVAPVLLALPAGGSLPAGFTAISRVTGDCITALVVLAACCSGTMLPALTWTGMSPQRRLQCLTDRPMHCCAAYAAAAAGSRRTNCCTAHRSYHSPAGNQAVLC